MSLGLKHTQLRATLRWIGDCRCNWYHATLNIGETLAAGGQQVEGSDADLGSCADDVDATANAQFQQGTQAITHGVASDEDEARVKSFATGEVMLQTALQTTPYRLDAWLWVRLCIYLF